MDGLLESIWNFVFIAFNLTIVLHLIKRFTSLVFQSRAITTGYVLVTGCDSGFGCETAKELSRRSIYVFAGCLTEEGVQRLREDKNFYGIAFVMDVTNLDDVENAKNIIEKEVKDNGLWCVVNNAGVLQPGPIEWQSLEEMKNTMNVNLWGAVNVTKSMLPLVKVARGRFVNITSMAGRVLFVHGTSYSMSKFALEAFSDGLRYEMKPWGVTVHIIEPGMFQTSILSSSSLREKWNNIWREQPDDIKLTYGENYFTHAETMSQTLRDTLASADIKKVVDAICHAVLSQDAKSRYSVGYDANTLWMAIATFPTNIGDFLLNLLAKPMTPLAMKLKS